MRATLSTIAAVLLAACGGNGPLDSARASLERSQRVVTDLDARVVHGPASFGGETAARVADPAHHAGWQALLAAMSDARTRLADAESSFDAWERDDAGDLAWRTVAPCLMAALERVAGALRTVSATDDSALEEAITRMRAESVDGCRVRDAPP